MKPKISLEAWMNAYCALQNVAQNLQDHTRKLVQHSNCGYQLQTPEESAEWGKAAERLKAEIRDDLISLGMAVNVVLENFPEP